jgi:hypothetical protein
MAKPICAGKAAPKSNKKRGPKPGTPSWRKFNYTPEFIAHCRSRYEETPESAVSIARDCGVDDSTIRRLAKDEGWVKFPAQQRGLPPDVALRRKVEAIAQSPLIPAQAGIQGHDREASGLGPGFPLSRGRVEEQTGSAHTTAIAQSIAEVQALLAAVAVMRVQAKTLADLQRAAQTMANLTATQRALEARQAAAAPQQPGQAHDAYDDNYDDLPADLDAFRLDLARRIDAFFEIRPDAGADAPADAAGPA